MTSSEPLLCQPNTDVTAFAIYKCHRTVVWGRVESATLGT